MWWKRKQELNWQESKLPESQCPYCEHKFNGALSPEGATPSPGDFSICRECVSILRFGDNMELLAVTADEISALKTQAPEFIEQLERMQKAVRALDRRPKT
jgi:hypothetical protein